MARVVTADIADTFEAGGVVQARTTAVLTARILAPVREVRVTAGDRVRAGQTLVVLDGRDLSARARGARIYATIDGYGSTCDAYHRVQMDPDGKEIVRCMHLAIDRSGRPLDEIGYINYHGTSTQLNDAIESRCTRTAFGALADRIPGSSTKSMIGHPQGASGAAGVVATALALSRGYLPPTINQTDPDPRCDLDVIPNIGRAVQGEAALCNCLGFGSKNSAVVLGRSDG